MKKLVFSVIAAVALVSVSNVFAGNKMVAVASAEPVDTVAPVDTTQQTPAQPTDTTKQAPVDTPVTPTATAE
ncbi:MAG TPA: hypothetical protein DDW28_01525 [Prevotella sp.]|nr:hypothetical protein [uncultured Prevotella sp.]HBF04832.1 hypothetical protein [Candidatus Segatella violae]